MFIKGKDNDEERRVNQPMNQSTNQSTQRQAISANPSFSTSFQQIQSFQQALRNLSNFNTLFLGFSKVSDKFLTVLFHSFVVKSKIFSSNSSVLVSSSIQVFINFLAQYCFHSEI